MRPSRSSRARKCRSTSSAPTAPLVGDDWKKYYDYDGKTRSIKWDAVNALKAPAKCMKTAADLKK